MLSGHNNSPIYGLALDRTERFLFTGADGRLIKVWDVRTGNLLWARGGGMMYRRTIRGHHSKITDLVINRNNSVLMSSSEDGWIMFWDITPLTYPSRPQINTASYHFLASCCKHKRFVAQLRYDATTDLLFSVADDGYVYAWNVTMLDPLLRRLSAPLSENDLCVLSFRHQRPSSVAGQQDNSVLFCDINRTSELLVTGAADGTAWVWRIPPVVRDANGITRRVGERRAVQCSGRSWSAARCS